MSQSYRIETLGQKALWENAPDKGDYPATLHGFEGEVLIFHDASKPYDPPRIGDEIFGTVEPDKRGNLRFKRASRFRSSTTSGQPRQSEGPGLTWRSAPYERGAEHPRNEARAIHTSAVSAAPAYYELLRTEGVIPQAPDKASMLNTLSGIVAWLEGGYGPVLDAVSAPASGAGQNGAERQQEIPADTEGLQPAATAADESIPF